MNYGNYPLAPTLSPSAESALAIEFADLIYNLNTLNYDNTPWFTLATMALRTSMSKLSSLESEYTIAETIAIDTFGRGVTQEQISDIYTLLQRMTGRIRMVIGNGIAVEWNVIFKRGAPSKVIIEKSGLDYVR